MWISGNSLTVYGNSLDNSLLIRCSFYWNGVKKFGREKFLTLGKFKDNERAITYGDDGTSACSDQAREISCFSAKEQFFQTIGMKITDAKKSDNPQDFVDFSDIDFLKRKSVYHDELGCKVGALAKNSLYKMLHMSSGQGEPEDLAISSMTSMLHEAFLHGQEFYEDSREKLIQVARKNKIYTNQLDMSYSDRVVDWKYKYQDL